MTVHARNAARCFLVLRSVSPNTAKVSNLQAHLHIHLPLLGSRTKILGTRGILRRGAPSGKALTYDCMTGSLATAGPHLRLQGPQHQLCMRSTKTVKRLLP